MTIKEKIKNITKNIKSNIINKKIEYDYDILLSYRTLQIAFCGRCLCTKLYEIRNATKIHNLIIDDTLEGYTYSTAKYVCDNCIKNNRATHTVHITSTTSTTFIYLEKYKHNNIYYTDGIYINDKELFIKLYNIILNDKYSNTLKVLKIIKEISKEYSDIERLININYKDSAEYIIYNCNSNELEEIINYLKDNKDIDVFGKLLVHIIA